MSAPATPRAAHGYSFASHPVRVPISRPLARKAAGLVVFGACIWGAFRLADPAELLRRLAAVDAPLLVAAFVLIALTNVVSYARMQAALGLFGFTAPTGLAVRAFLVGQISNQLLANIFGQSMSRAAVLRAGNVPVSVSVFATFIERAVAAASLLALSLASAACFMGRVVLDLERGGAYLISILLGIAIALATLGGVMLARHRDDIRRICTARTAVQGLLVLGLTLATHTAMLAGYVAVLAGLGIDALRPDIAGALLIVMFTASLPISFGGWGLRELSAAHALGLVGVPAPTAIAAAALVGLLAMAATLLPMAGAMLLRGSYPDPRPTGPEPETASARHRGAADAAAGWDKILLWVCSALTAALVFFQVRVPLAHAEINVNPADLVALTALGIAVTSALINRTTDATAAWFWRGLMVLTSLVAAGLAIGYGAHGWNDWAILNRGLGWLVLAGYAVAGAAAANVRGARGRGTVLLAFAATGLTVCAAQVSLLEVDRFIAAVPRDVLAYPLEGFARNRNAFAFQILLLLAALAVLLRAGEIGWRTHAAGCGLALIVVWETLSRTGWIIAAMLIFALALTVERIERARFLLRLAAGLALTLGLYISCSYTLAAMSGTELTGAMLQTVQRHEGLFLRPDADGERWGTLIAGLKLWLAHPLTGAGLGGFVAARESAHLPFQVIHSVPVWLLAELGLLGLAVALAIGADWVVRARRALSDPETEPYAVGLLAILMVMAVGGLVHDFLYQRSFWLLAGLFAAGMSRRPGGTEVAPGQIPR